VLRVVGVSEKEWGGSAFEEGLKRLRQAWSGCSQSVSIRRCLIPFPSGRVIFSSYVFRSCYMCPSMFIDLLLWSKNSHSQVPVFFLML
jgi:hypothetical protein